MAGSCADPSGVEFRDVAALAAVLLAEEKGIAWQRNGRTVSAPLALMSGDLVMALMKLAGFSLNLQGAAGALAAGQGLPSGHEALLLMGFDHAMDAVPDLDGMSGEVPLVRDCQTLFRMVSEIEDIFGPVPCDTDLVSRIQVAAQARIAAAQPVTRGPAA